MKRRNIFKLSIFIAIVLTLLCTSFTPQIIANGHPHSLKGVLYINDKISPEGIEIILSFTDGDEDTITYEYKLYDDFTNYNLGFWDHEGQTGFFTVKYQENEIEPLDNKTVFIEEGTIGYFIDLHINTLGSPPDKPTQPIPENNSENITLNTFLRVLVHDIDEEPMDVSFYDASDDSLIDIDTDVPSGSLATVQWMGLNPDTQYFWYAVANDSIYETKSDVWNFRTEIIINNPPDKPTSPKPADGAEDVDLNPVLSVTVTDPDDDFMDVTFYDASDDQPIGTDSDVPSGGKASIQLINLSYNTTYSWYAIANDSMQETKSDTWSFTTEEEDDTPPTVKIIKPQKGLYIFDRKILPRFIRPAMIIGKVTIEAEATDDDSGIDRVEFYVNGKCKGTDTTAPYEFLWKRDRIRLLHIFVIKVVAYDMNGLEASDKMIVRKFV